MPLWALPAPQAVNRRAATISVSRVKRSFFIAICFLYDLDCAFHYSSIQIIPCIAMLVGAYGLNKRSILQVFAFLFTFPCFLELQRDIARYFVSPKVRECHVKLLKPL